VLFVTFVVKLVLFDLTTKSAKHTKRSVFCLRRCFLCGESMPFPMLNDWNYKT